MHGVGVESVYTAAFSVQRLVEHVLSRAHKQVGGMLAVDITLFIAQFDCIDNIPGFHY